jgi:hypothetical protein
MDRARLRKVVDRFLQGDATHEELIRQLVMVAAWHEACVGGATEESLPRRVSSRPVG